MDGAFAVFRNGIYVRDFRSPSICACLAQSVERQALNLMVVGSSPTVGVFLCTKHRARDGGCVVMEKRQRQDANLRGQSPMDF